MEKISYYQETVKEPLSMSEIIEKESDAIVTSASYYNDLTEYTQSKLREIAAEVIGVCVRWKKQSQMIAAEVGGKLLQAKELFIDEGKEGSWQLWIENELSGQLSHDSVNNLINLHRFINTHGEDYSEGINNLSMSALYALARTSVPEEVQKKVLIDVELADEPPSPEEVKALVSQYRQIRVRESKISPKAADILAKYSIVEDPSQLQKIEKLSETRQLQVAELIEQGAANTQEALDQLKKKKEEEKETEKHTVPLPIDGVKSKTYKGAAVKVMDKIPVESVDVAIIEAPMKFEFVQNPDGFTKLCRQTGNLLKPGGYALITIGHKGALFTGQLMEGTGLAPLHLLVLRRTPGRSRSIVGINITSASVLLVLAYKPPFNAPKKMIVDLQTIQENDDDAETGEAPELIEGMDHIESGIEHCLKRFLTPIVNANDTILHCVYGADQFQIRESLKAVVNDCGASKFFEVG